MAELAKHPAKYTDSLLPIFGEILERTGCKTVLDPFAGVGRIHWLQQWGFETYGNEIEWEWASQAAPTVLGDATNLPFRDASFDAIVVSPTYSNRMADCHEARDYSRRNTYTHTLGRKLHKNNSGQMQWGHAYRNLHQAAWLESRRVLKPGGRFILNISDHIRDGKKMPVAGWHVKTLQSYGFHVDDIIPVVTPRNKFGANGHLRVPAELVIELHLKEL